MDNNRSRRKRGPDNNRSSQLQQKVARRSVLTVPSCNPQGFRGQKRSQEYVAFSGFHFQPQQIATARIPVPEMNSYASLTPLDIFTGRSAVPHEGVRCSSVNSTPTSSWSSLILSDFRVPSLSREFGETSSISNCTSTPAGYARRRQCGWLRPGVEHSDSDHDGEQRVPIHNPLRNSSTRTQEAGNIKAHLVPTPYSCEFEAAQGRGDNNSNPVFDRHRFDATTPDLGQGGEPSSLLKVSSVVHGSRPIYPSVSQVTVPVGVSGFKDKNTVVDETSHMDLEYCRTSGEAAASADGGNVRRTHVWLSLDLGRRLPEPQGIARGDGGKGFSITSKWEKEVCQVAQSMETDTHNQEPIEVNKTGVVRQSSEAEKSGQKQSSRHENSRVAAAEDGADPFIRLGRQHPLDQSSLRASEGEDAEAARSSEGHGVETGMVQITTSNWLQRWLQPNSLLLISMVNGKSRIAVSGISLGQSSQDELKQVQMWNRFQYRVTDFSRKGGVFQLSPFPTPSASAIAMVGAASSRCYRRSSALAAATTGHKGSIMIQRPDTRKLETRVKSVKFAESRRTS